jgi:ferredoxin
MMGDCTLAVRQAYAEEGLASEDGLLPDHLATELEFMSFLAQREVEAWAGGDEEGAVTRLRQQEAFLADHLGHWVPPFCQQVLTGEAHPFYADLAQRTRERVAQDMAKLRAWSRAGKEADEQDYWAAAVGSGCSLCGLCTRLCPRNAVGLKRSDDMVCLFFDPALCDGCAACQNWCPEGAVTVKSSPISEEEPVLLISSPLVICMGCGEPSLPEALLARVQRGAAGADGSLERQLALCPACRASSSLSTLVNKED